MELHRSFPYGSSHAGRGTQRYLQAHRRIIKRSEIFLELFFFLHNAPPVFVLQYYGAGLERSIDHPFSELGRYET